MIQVFNSAWRNAAWLCLVMFLSACTPAGPEAGPQADPLSNTRLPVETSLAQPTAPTTPSMKIELTPAASPTSESLNGNGKTEIPASSEPKSLPEAAQAALDHLSDFLDVPVDQIEVVSFKHVEWKTECLGISSPGSMCPQVITPGWVIVLQVEDQVYTYHTDETGNRVRRK